MSSDLIAPPSSPPVPLRSRKRTRDWDSDDLPVFSSDPVDPSIDNFTVSKRRHRGPWWNHSQHSSSFSRNFDSGIHIPSDDSLSDSQCPEPSSPYKAASMTHLSSSSEGAPTSLDHASRIINEVLDNSLQEVDLSDLGLLSLPPSISSLETLVRIPRYANAEGFYESLQPAIQLFLANNALKKLPPAIFDLKGLTVLSLRNNNLASLPGSICRLTNLVELNVANNNLRYLPWELLQLLGPDKPLKKLHVKPNPLVKGVELDGFGVARTRRH
jgi:hypothetical protein